jgi:hypothetical protein
MPQYIVQALRNGNVVREGVFVSTDIEAALAHAKGDWPDVGRVSWNALHGEDYPNVVARLTNVAPDPLFVCVIGEGVVYSDWTREAGGDFARLARLSFGTLELDIEKDCPPELKAKIEQHAALIQSRRGEPYEVSATGQTITLGFKLK